MRKNDYLSAVADSFGINASALRFWEKEGLIRFERDKENNYRLPAASSIADIWEVMILKSIGFSSKQIKSALRAEPDGIRAILKDGERRLRLEIEKLQNSLARLEEKKAQLKKLAALQNRPPEIARKKELHAVPYSETTREIVRYLLDNEYANASFVPKESAPVYAVIDSDAAFFEKFRRAPAEATCVHGLLRIGVTDPADNNAGEFFAAADKAGFAAEGVIGQYLVSAMEGDVRYDFFEGYAFCAPE